MSSAIDILRGRGPARALLAAATLALLALAGCGGGDDRVSTFTPQRLVVLGDETSVIVAAGSTDAQGNAIVGPVGNGRPRRPPAMWKSGGRAHQISAQVLRATAARRTGSSPRPARRTWQSRRYHRLPYVQA